MSQNISNYDIRSTVLLVDIIRCQNQGYLEKDINRSVKHHTTLTSSNDCKPSKVTRQLFTTYLRHVFKHNNCVYIDNDTVDDINKLITDESLRLEYMPAESVQYNTRADGQLLSHVKKYVEKGGNKEEKDSIKRNLFLEALKPIVELALSNDTEYKLVQTAINRKRKAEAAVEEDVEAVDEDVAVDVEQPTSKRPKRSKQNRAEKKEREEESEVKKAVKKQQSKKRKSEEFIVDEDDIVVEKPTEPAAVTALIPYTDPRDFIIFNVPCHTVPVYNPRRHRLWSSKGYLFHDGIPLITHYISSRVVDDNTFKNLLRHLHPDKNTDGIDSGIEAANIARRFIEDNMINEGANWDRFLDAVYDYKVGNIDADRFVTRLWDCCAFE